MFNFSSGKKYLHKIYLFIEFSNQIDKTNMNKSNKNSTTSKDHYKETHGNDDLQKTTANISTENLY